MGQEGTDGYYAEFAGLKRGGEDARAEAEHVAEVYRELLAAFAAAPANPLGQDQYAAELAKTYPAQRDSIFKVFEAYVDDLDGVRDGLVNGAKLYESAERPEV
ncbi:hypothetical protein HII36_53765 [Nonomuraea sp. NN258]|uniref:hypothetical protein n=1 Tax=Nonomuraea antri TaxID=2730852 RepID=UPI001568CAA1|nr:hypothetical protein [Nonomuraea antri]NRQ40622.1 hypothetical protein [Nonomuraea antri]